MNATIVFLSGALFITAWMMREYQWAKEREKLLDRLMAKSLPEFKHEIRKEEIMRKKPEPKPFPSDAEMAEWELKHTSQVANNSAELDKALTELQRKAVQVTGGNHGS